MNKKTRPRILLQILTPRPRKLCNSEDARARHHQGRCPRIISHTARVGGTCLSRPGVGGLTPACPCPVSGQDLAWSLPPNYPHSDSIGTVGAEPHDSAAAPSPLCHIIVGPVSLKTLSDPPSSSRSFFSSSCLPQLDVDSHNADNQHDNKHKTPSGTLTTFDDTCHPSCPSPCLSHHRFSHPLATRQSTRPPVCLSPPRPRSPIHAGSCFGHCTAAVRAMLTVVGRHGLFHHGQIGSGCWSPHPPPPGEQMGRTPTDSLLCQGDQPRIWSKLAVNTSHGRTKKVGGAMMDGVPELSSFFAKMISARTRSNSQFFSFWIFSCGPPALC